MSIKRASKPGKRERARSWDVFPVRKERRCIEGMEKREGRGEKEIEEERVGQRKPSK